MADGRQSSTELGEGLAGNRVDTYEFQPIKGYPMLSWHGKRPFTSTQNYPAQLKEVHGTEVEGWLNKIFWGDNLQVMSHLLKEHRGQVDLAYIDPPFDSGADYKKSVRLRGHTAHGDHSTFEEKQYADIWTNDEFLQFIFERLILIRELLSQTGTVAVQCDWRRAHHLRCVLDEVFGNANFRGEALIPAGTKNVQSQFEAVSSLTLGSNSIFIYTKSLDTRLKKLVKVHDSLEPGKWDTFWRGTDRPTMRYDLLGQKPAAGQWRWKRQRALRAVDNYVDYVQNASSDSSLDDYYIEKKKVNGEDLDFVRLSDDGVVQYYVPPRDYKILSNVWFDLRYRGTQTDYPTEKHEDIATRLIQWLTEPGDLVLDSFMGSGTTQAAAMKLGRRFIGADINLGAVQTTTKRILTAATEIAERQLQAKLGIEDGKEPNTSYYTGFEVYNVNHYDVFRNPIEARGLLLDALEIQPLGAGNLFDGEKDGRMVKVMSVNRIATRQDLNEIIANLDYKAFERRLAAHPSEPVERITLVCMGHEPDLKAILEREVKPYKIDVEVVDILRDRQDLQFKRDSEAHIVIRGGELIIEQFYPMNLLQKLSLQKETVEDWREMVESVMVDWNYDGAVLEPAVVDLPEKNELVGGRYTVPRDAGTIRVKITDLLSESLEQEVAYG